MTPIPIHFINHGEYKVNLPETLPNGARVISRYYILGENSWIVLCIWRPLQPYVTWRTDNEGNAYSGHYFSDFGQAIRDFEERCQKFFYRRREVERQRSQIEQKRKLVFRIKS